MDFFIVNENEPIRPLVAGLKIDVQEYIKEVRRDNLVISCMTTPTGLNPSWDSYRLESFVQKFSEFVFNFQEKVSKDF